MTTTLDDAVQKLHDAREAVAQLLKVLDDLLQKVEPTSTQPDTVSPQVPQSFGGEHNA